MTDPKLLKAGVPTGLCFRVIIQFFVVLTDSQEWELCMHLECRMLSCCCCALASLGFRRVLGFAFLHPCKPNYLTKKMLPFLSSSRGVAVVDTRSKLGKLPC